MEEQDLSFEVKEANNNTIDSEKSFNAASEDPFHGYCPLCQTTGKLILAFRNNMTKLMFGLLFVQASLIALFLQSQVNLFLQKELLEFIDLWSMYILFMIEIFINTGVLYARYKQYSGTTSAKGALKESKKKAEDEMEEKRRTLQEERFALQKAKTFTEKSPTLAD